MASVLLGIDRLLLDSALRKPLLGKRIGLLAHAASATRSAEHTLDALMKTSELNIVCLFSPQHGFHSEKQDNMIESPHGVHPKFGIPVFSLYSHTRQPTDHMMATFDVIMVDLQDIGSRVYTYLTTVYYMMQACASHGKEMIILDRPNPAGRPVEGIILEKGWESFIGITPTIMRHGMTLGELATWWRLENRWTFPCQVIWMSNYDPNGPGLGWPRSLSWINPSPNVPSVHTARYYPGMVLFEGTTLSEGRGTTHPFGMIGAPDLDFQKLLEVARDLVPQWFAGCHIRLCHFEPTFDKHAKKLCHGIQLHINNDAYDHYRFKPFRIALALLKAIRICYPNYVLWHANPFEYVYDKKAIDLLSGSDFIRTWIDDPNSAVEEMEIRLTSDEQRWDDVRKPFLKY